MKTHFIVLGLAYLILIGCGIEQAIRKNEDRYAKPGAMDMAISSNPYYVKHSLRILNRYLVKHEWLNGQGTVAYGGYLGKTQGLPLRIFDSLGDIYEEQGITWYQADKRYAGINPKTGQYWRTNFDSYVRSVKYQQPIYAPITAAESRAEVEATLKRIRNPKKNLPTTVRQPISYQEVETGYKPVCFESWWTTSHFITLFLRKQPLNEMKAGFTKWYPESSWTTKTINNLTWYVQETPEDKFRPRPLNGVGGPFQTWVLPLADTGYTMALELGASKESLQYPDAHARIQVMFRHLIESVRIESIQTDSPSTSSTTTEAERPVSQVKPATSETKQVLPKGNGSKKTIGDRPQFYDTEL